LFGWIKGNKPPRTADDYPRSVWEIETIKPGTKTDHPTSKPVKVFEIPILQHTTHGEICYEPFCGSGSQLIACEQLGRICYGMEISPQYCEVICQRWEKLTGQKRQKVAAE
jgi:DNA modification methylase